MGISDYATKVVGDKRRWKAYKARMEALPLPYRTAVAGLERYINHLGGMGDGDSIMTMLEDLATLFEQAAASGTPVRAIVGADPVEFIVTFLSNYPAGRWITREQERLVVAIDLAEQQEQGTPA